MTYYIMLPGDNIESLQYSTNILGQVSFDNFWPEQGLEILMKIVNEKPEILSDIIIINDKKEKISITQFLDIIKKLNVKF